MYGRRLYSFFFWMLAITNIREINAINPCNGPFIKTNGTTCGLKEIMIGRCYQYQYVTRNLYLANTTSIKNCSELYELFASAVSYTPFCDVNMTAFRQYFELALEGVEAINPAMFWSGTNPIAHDISNQGINYITLEDTLAAGMANKLSWCGTEDNNTDGFDYDSCPYSRSCTNSAGAFYAFWNYASQTFAQKAAGEIYVVLNGSQTNGSTAFYNGSIFATIELPNLQRNGSNRVTKINVLLLHSPDQNVSETCDNGSLITLENIIRNYTFGYTCQDDPYQIILIMCAVQWNARECQAARNVLTSEWNQGYFQKSNATFHSISILFLFCLMINYFY